MTNSRSYTLITALFAVVLVVSNVAASKVTSFWGLTLDAGTVLFPLSYIFGDVLTEVYGYAASRRVIWIGFASTFLAAATFMIVGALPPAPEWGNQAAYESILGLTPRIVCASLVAFLIGEFANSYVLARMKVAMAGKYLWMRTVGSTLVGELLDTSVFTIVAFWGVFPDNIILPMIISMYLFKVAIEAVFTPVTYAVVRYLKKHEGVDVYDRDTNFNPFRV
ncbi:MAG: hypothetical protein RLZZ342_22 [Candidatus Parcubacteria bacterium]|jgi:uncharacterized integral membrane protein (TIGR00697 family)